MENVENEQTNFPSNATEVEKSDVVESEKQVSLGKFKNVQSLIEAYNSLQSEFTKRCQRIKELEGNNSQTIEDTCALKEGQSKTEEKKVSEEEKMKILKEYLKDVMGSKQNAVLLDEKGVGVKTPFNKPKTISEAGKLVKEMLQK